MNMCDGKHCGNTGNFNEYYTWNRYYSLNKKNYIIKQKFCDECIDFSIKYNNHLTHFECYNCSLIKTYEEYCNKQNISFDNEGVNLVLFCDSCMSDDTIIKYNTTTNMIGNIISIY